MTLVALLLLGALDAGSPDAGVPVTVSADRLEVKTKDRQATYRGHAHATQGTAVLDADTLTAHYGPEQSIEKLEAQGALRFADGDRRAEAEAATYDPRTGVLTVPGAVVATAGKRTVKGQSATYMKASRVLEVQKPIAAFGAESLPGAAPGDATVESDVLRFEEDAKSARFQGNVKARRQGTVLTAPTLVAHYDEHGALTRVDATGGVHVRDRTRTATGARASWEAKSGLLVVTGKPIAKDGTQTLSGSRVLFRPGSELLEVEDATAVLSPP